MSRPALPSNWVAEWTHETCGHTWRVPVRELGQVKKCPGCGFKLSGAERQKARMIAASYLQALASRTAGLN